MFNKILILSTLSFLSLCTTLNAFADQEPTIAIKNIPSAASPTVTAPTTTPHKTSAKSQGAPSAYAAVIQGSGIPRSNSSSSLRIDNSPSTNIRVRAPEVYTLQTRSVPSVDAIHVYINDVPREYYIPRPNVQVIQEPVYYMPNEYTRPHHHHYHYHYQYHWGHRVQNVPVRRFITSNNVFFFQYR